MPNIYELPQEVEETMKLHDQCFDENGEMIVSEEFYNGLVKELERLQNKQNELIEWALRKRANAEANKTALEDESKRLLERAKREEKTVEQMERLIAHFLPEIDKKLTIANWDVSYTKSEATIVIDPLQLPEKLLVHTVEPTDNLYYYRDVLEGAGIGFNVTTKAPLKGVKEWLELLSEEEREKIKDNVRIEQRKKLKIK